MQNPYKTITKSLSHALRAFDERSQPQKQVFAVASVFKNRGFLIPCVKTDKKETK